jgi:hypothetical protein
MTLSKPAFASADLKRDAAFLSVWHTVDPAGLRLRRDIVAEALARETAFRLARRIFVVRA